MHRGIYHLSFVTATLLFSLICPLQPLPVRAENPEHLRRLRETKQCVECDLSGADLTGMSLVQADLSGANLQGAKLGGVGVIAADLSNANLQGANLSGADLRGAMLKGANLTRTNLSNADLRNANLTGVELKDANLTDAIGFPTSNPSEANQQAPNQPTQGQTRVRGIPYFTPEPGRSPGRPAGGGTR